MSAYETQYEQLARLYGRRRTSKRGFAAWLRRVLRSGKKKGEAWK